MDAASQINLIPVFLVGLLGGVHCVGMCGGIVGAFSMRPAAPSPSARPFPVPVVGMPAAPAIAEAFSVVSYNAGRIASYMLAGALVGGVGSGVRLLSAMSPLQLAAYWLANLMLVLLGLTLMGAWHGLGSVEAVGQLLWRHIRPLTRYLLPLDSVPKAFGLGALWGWLPCGMVYSMLFTAMLAGSAPGGAAVMLAFGLGTLPTLMSMGLLGRRLQPWLQKRPVRIASGGVVLLFGVLGMARAVGGLPLGWLGALCTGVRP